MADEIAERYSALIYSEKAALRLLDEEVAQIMRDCAKWDVDNRWIGSRETNGTAQVGRAGMAHAIGEHAAGLRNHTTVHYNYLHIKLRANNIVPLRPGLEVSHLCHDRDCTDVTHIIYETRKDNNARNSCIHFGKCCLTKYKQGGFHQLIPKPPCNPPCLVGVHGKRKLHDGSRAKIASTRKKRAASTDE